MANYINQTRYCFAPRPAAYALDEADGLGPRATSLGRETRFGPGSFRAGASPFTGLYQPQLDGWKGRDLSGRAAVAVKDAASPEEHFGVIWFTAKTNVNRAENRVTLEDITITKGNFPATPDKADQYLQALRCECTTADDRPFALSSQSGDRCCPS